MLPPALIDLAALLVYLALDLLQELFPWVYFVVSDESVSTIAAGLNLLKSIMPSGAFFGRGCEISPECILIDELLAKVVEMVMGKEARH